MSEPFMKEKKLIPLLSLIFLCVAGLFILSSNALSSPSVAEAQSRRTPTNTKPPKVTHTKAPPSDTPSPTVTPSITPSPTNTPTNTPTITPSPTQTNTPTITPSPTATPFPRGVLLNEILSQAKFKDWNEDGSDNADDAWIELVNLGDHPADVSGWTLDTGKDTPSYLVPNETILPPGGFVILFRKQTQLNLDQYHRLRLLFPDGDISDDVRYPSLEDDRVYARLHDGQDPWRLGCVPTPLSPNCQSAESVTSQFNLPFFQRAIYGPVRHYDPEVVVTNLLLAIILALAIGFFSNLLNDAIETHEDDYAHLFAPFINPFNKVRARIRGVDRVVSSSRTPWMGFIVKLVVLLLLYGTILAYLDPNFQFINQDGFLLIVALGFSTGLIAILDDLAVYLYLRSKGGGGRMGLHSSNFLMVITTTLFSRVANLVPGLLLGSPAGIEDIPDEHNGPHLDILAILVTAAASLVAWAFSAYTVDPWLSTLLLLTFGAGMQTIFFEMLPLSYLRGKSIFQFNPLLWLILFVGATVLFLQTMLNPNGPFLSAFQSANMTLLSVFTALYCLICALIWFFLTRAASNK